MAKELPKAAPLEPPPAAAVAAADVAVRGTRNGKHKNGKGGPPRGADPSPHGPLPGLEGAAWPRPDKTADRAAKTADRAAESMYRIVCEKHEHLSAMADTKAHIMITICVAIVGVSALQTFDPLLQYAAATLIVTCLVAAGFAVYATMPSLPAQKRPDPQDPGFNLLFFSDFARLPYDVYEQEMEQLVRDRRRISRALTKDLHRLGTVLQAKKYRYLAFCYRTFLAGLVLSAVVLAVSLAVGQT
jgi:Family of unknown function (DUF5706)